MKNFYILFFFFFFFCFLGQIFKAFQFTEKQIDSISGEREKEGIHGLFKKANEKGKQMEQATDVLSIFFFSWVPLLMSFVGILWKDL